MTMSNRDYFNRPMQGDRHHHSYGNNKLQPMKLDKPTWGEALFYACPVLIVMGYVAFFS